MLRRRTVGDISLDDVAQAASLDRASIYYYFSNKGDLIAEVVRDALSHGRSHRGLIEPDLPPTEKLSRWIVSFIEDCDKFFPIYSIYIHQDLDRLPVSSALKDELVRISTRGFDQLVGIIEEGMKDGSFDTTLSPGIAAETIIGAVAWSHRWYEPGRSLGPSAIGHGMADMLLNGLRSPSSPRKRVGQARSRV